MSSGAYACITGVASALENNAVEDNCKLQWVPVKLYLLCEN
jgi:hypothetical protein